MPIRGPADPAETSTGATQRAEARLVLGTLMAGLTHDLATPVTLLLSNLEYAASQLAATAIDPEVKDSVRDAHQSARDLCELVRDVQRVVAIEPWAPGPVDVLEPLRASLRLCGRHAASRGVRVALTEPDATVRAWSNEGPLTRVCCALILAACEGNRGAQPRELAITVASEAEWVVLELRVSGEPLDEPDASKLRSAMLSAARDSLRALGGELRSRDDEALELRIPSAPA